MALSDDADAAIDASRSAAMLTPDSR